MARHVEMGPKKDCCDDDDETFMERTKEAFNEAKEKVAENVPDNCKQQ